MTIVRIISIGSVVMVASAIGIASLDPSYALLPCCGYRNGVYVNLKTGKPVKPPTAHIAPTPHPASPPTAGGAATGTGGGGHK